MRDHINPSSTRAAALGRRLQEMLGSKAGVGWAEIGGVEGLYVGEREAVAKAVPGRVAEHSAGRRAARMALAELGLPEAEIPVGRHRAPVWPESVAGSITHDRGVALAAVITNGGIIGIDLTEAVPLPDDVRQTILPHDEEAELTEIEARIAFSAKESLFKALFPITETYLGFEAAVFVPERDGDFSLCLGKSVGTIPSFTKWRGHMIILGEDLLTCLRVQGDWKRSALLNRTQQS